MHSALPSRITLARYQVKLARVELVRTRTGAAEKHEASRPRHDTLAGRSLVGACIVGSWITTERMTPKEVPMSSEPEEAATAPAEEVERLRRELLEAGARPVVLNHLFGLFELASVFLGADPPRLADASLAIDAMAGLLGATEDQLGPEASPLHEGLRQLQLAYVQVARLGDD
jgi:hypothetical protein